MPTLRDEAKRLLEAGDAGVVIGYEENGRGGVRALFIRHARGAERLVFTPDCRQNLAVYLRKKEVKKMGKPAVVAHAATLRTLIQLAAEKQIDEGDVMALAVASDGETTLLRSFADIESFAESSVRPLVDAEDLKKLRMIESLDLPGRWKYWQEHLSRCFKCFACRAACPLCYCDRCTVETNQPQWISVPAHALGNLEWHLMRAMHLAGRCIGCGECTRACPMGIPVHLISLNLADQLYRSFGTEPGVKVKVDHALSTFKPGDEGMIIK